MWKQTFTYCKCEGVINSVKMAGGVWMLDYQFEKLPTPRLATYTTLWNLRIFKIYSLYNIYLSNIYINFSSNEMVQCKAGMKVLANCTFISLMLFASFSDGIGNADL